MSSLLETLDQLCGGDLRLQVVRSLFESHDHFRRAILAMLRADEVNLIDSDGSEVPVWQWSSTLERPDCQMLSITSKGICRIE